MDHPSELEDVEEGLMFHFWTSEIDSRLGRESDTAIAHDIGLTPTAVASRRRKLGIPAAPRIRTGPRPVQEPEQPWRALVRDRLGVVRDTDLAGEVGVSPTAVSQYRASLGIPRANVTSMEIRALRAEVAALRHEVAALREKLTLWISTFRANLSLFPDAL